MKDEILTGKTREIMNDHKRNILDCVCGGITHLCHSYLTSVISVKPAGGTSFIQMMSKDCAFYRHCSRPENKETRKTDDVMPFQSTCQRQSEINIVFPLELFCHFIKNGSASVRFKTFFQSIACFTINILLLSWDR